MINTYMSDPIVSVRPTYYTGYAIARFVDVFIGMIEIALAIRFVLKLLGASASAPFVAWVYDGTQSLVAPFSGMFAPAPGILTPFEFSTIVAVVAYAALGWVLLYVVTSINSTAERIVFRS